MFFKNRKEKGSSSTQEDQDEKKVRFPFCMLK